MYVRVETRRRSQSSIWLVAIAVLSLALLPLLSGTVLSPSPDTSTDNVTALRSDFGNLPLSFEPNEGQTDDSVRFLTHASGGTLYFTTGEVVLSLPSGSKSESQGAQVGVANNVTAGNLTQTQDAQHASQASVVRMRFVGANPSASIQSRDLLPGKVNYFIGNDPSKWHAGLPTYSGVIYSGLYPGVDLSYEGTGGQLKGTYTVAAGSDPSQIRWHYSGAEKVNVDETGNLQITVATAATLANTNKDAQAVTVTEQAPVAWQEIAGMRIAVSARYLVAPDQSIGFVLGRYDRNHPLIIDPTLTYSTYLGGSGGEGAYGIAVDASGNAYVTGYTYSTNFPLQNPFQPTYGGGYDVFATKFSATGSTLLYSTYLGGNGQDVGHGIAVDASGNAYVTGYTWSTNFPLQNPFQGTHGGGNRDVFVTKFSATGSTLTYSTYLGGSSRDWGNDIAVDSSGNAYVTGLTASTNFPIQNPFQPTLAGIEDVFVTKFNPTGSALVYSTYLGGSSSDEGWGIAVDTSGNAYVTGYTLSSNFPLQNPFQPTYGGGTDAFVSKFSSTGSTLIYSTHLGGNGSDVGNGIAVDASGNAYVTGVTTSTNFPLQNPFQPTYGGGSDVFVTKFSATGSTLLYSTYLGDSDDDAGLGIAVDTSGNAYVTGYTLSSNFPLQNPFQPTLGGGYDAFVTKFSPTGSTLLYSTYLGGSNYEYGNGIAVDTSGNAYVTGYTVSTNFPLQDPFQPTYGGGSDVFVAKISDQSVSTPTATSVPPTNTPVPPTNTPVPPTGTATATHTASATATSTATACVQTLNGHLTYQGMTQPNTGNVQPITLQLQPTGGGPVSTYSTSTDLNANFTVNLGPLPVGTYTWWLKSPRYLATAGSLTIPVGCAPFSQEFGAQRTGDVNNDNCVNITDFSLLRASFGLVCGDPGYNPNAEYSGDCLVDISDFGLLRGNFGTCGVSELTRPGGAQARPQGSADQGQGAASSSAGSGSGSQSGSDSKTGTGTNGTNINKNASAVPLNDAYHLLNPCNISVTQGQTFTLDLLVNAGTHLVTAQQAYMTFTPGLLKIIPPGGTCGQSATTVQLDGSTFEASLQNVVNNSTGEIAFASGTFGDPGAGQFRVARLHFCAEGSGTATINWQFIAPRSTGITDDQVPPNRVENQALYQNCTVTITGGATATAVPPTQTRTATAVPPAATQASTRTGTTIPPTSTVGSPPSTSVPPTPTSSPSTATPPRPAATPTATPGPDAPTATPLPAGSRYFPETKHTVKGLFLNYWNTHGGLPQQGYPITEELQEQSDTNGKVYTMQYFERAVFEHHPENAAPYNVLLSLLGNFYYIEKYAGNAPNQRATTSNPLKFVETGKTIGGAFRKYWETHGGLPQQGFPISDEFQEVSQTDGRTYTVQYFQRAVFEYHPEYAGTKDEVLLSLLGVFYDKKKHPRAP